MSEKYELPLLKFDIGPDHGASDIAVGLMQMLVGIEGPPPGMTSAEYLTALEGGGGKIAKGIGTFRQAGDVMHKLICATVKSALLGLEISEDEAPIRGAAARRRPHRRAPRH